MHIAVVSPINTPDGISRYSRSLYSALPNDIQISFLANQDISSLSENDDSSVSRLWIGKNKNFKKVSTWVSQKNPDLVHIQLHPEYFPPICLNELLKQLEGKKVIVTIHSFGNWYTQYSDLLNTPAVHKVIIHKQDGEAIRHIDQSKLEIIPLGYSKYQQINKNKLKQQLGIEPNSPVIITHGLATPSKGLLETAAAVKELRNTYPQILWLALNAVNPNNPRSQMIMRSLKDYVAANSLESSIKLISNFLTDTQVSSLVQVADIGLFGYLEVGEGASDAVRKFISCGIPTIVTDTPVMKEFDSEVYKIADNQPVSIIEGIKDLWTNEELKTKISSAARSKSTELSWDKIATRLLSVYQS